MQNSSRRLFIHKYVHERLPVVFEIQAENAKKKKILHCINNGIYPNFYDLDKCYIDFV